VNLHQRVELLSGLGQYLLANGEQWQAAKEKAGAQNNWFVPQFVDLAAKNIAEGFLQPGQLNDFAAKYPLRQKGWYDGRLGLVMAGNIPLVGFHDFLCAFLAGIPVTIKTSSKDEVLITHLVQQLMEWEPALETQITFAPPLKNCTAYIATGSNNSSRYFDYYFRNYPHIIRRNRTSLAMLTGSETEAELDALADDMMLFFGLGCRNVSKLLVPEGYHFEPLLNALNRFAWMGDHHKYKNNYDYNLALHLLNNTYYMTNGALLLIEKESLFSPISQVNYSFYQQPPDTAQLKQDLKEDLQCVVAAGHTPFGKAQSPAIDEFADGIDTMAFLTSL
jgi:hypothetical protein